MRAPQSRAYKAAEGDLEYVAVCLVGYEQPVPRHFGDNQGAWPVRVATTSKPQEIVRKADSENPLHGVRILEIVWTASLAHAKRLKAELDKLLLGSGQEDRALRHGWRDCEADPAVAWAILLEDALRVLRRSSSGFDVFDESEKRRKTEKKAGVNL
jgi:hypothetical protein